MSSILETKAPIVLAIERAVGAHGLWKTRIQTSIETGKIDTTVQQVANDHLCEFGKWLHGPSISPQIQQTTHFKEVVRLHAEFHKAAAQTLTLATTGQKSAAQAMMWRDGAFNQCSNRLTAAMIAWKKAVQ